MHVSIRDVSEMYSCYINKEWKIKLRLKTEKGDIYPKEP